MIIVQLAFYAYSLAYKASYQAADFNGEIAIRKLLISITNFKIEISLILCLLYELRSETSPT